MSKHKVINAVEFCEMQYPETTAEFKKITEDQYELFCKKQMNYGAGNISQGISPLDKPEDIKFSLTGLFFRMNDKISRMKQLVVNSVADEVGESLEDTYQDLSVYNVIAQIVSRGKWGK